MKKQHNENTVGPWARAKLDALEEYLKFYTTALSKQKFELVYIDASAGSGLAKLRSAEVEETLNFLDDPEDSEAVAQYLAGSPLRALNIERGFHRHYFFDADPRRAQTLSGMRTEFGEAKNIEVEVGDANPLIQALASRIGRRNIRGVAFLDPYGPHLEWATIEALAKTKKFEVFINFPVGMAINRLITRSSEIPERWNSQLNLCFGTEDWKNEAYKSELDLFGELQISKNADVSQRLLSFYMMRLKKIFGHVATPRLIRNTRSAPLYYLIWAGPHSLGLKGADYILSQGERVVLRRT